MDNVISFPVNNPNDIPAMLRKLADGVESGEYKPDSLVYVMRADDGYYTGILGLIDIEAAIGILSIAGQFLVQEAVEE